MVKSGNIPILTGEIRGAGSATCESQLDAIMTAVGT
jgi:hypothetical protein